MKWHSILHLLSQPLSFHSTTHPNSHSHLSIYLSSFYTIYPSILLINLHIFFVYLCYLFYLFFSLFSGKNKQNHSTCFYMFGQLHPYHHQINNNKHSRFSSSIWYVWIEVKNRCSYLLFILFQLFLLFIFEKKIKNIADNSKQKSVNQDNLQNHRLLTFL